MCCERNKPSTPGLVGMASNEDLLREAVEAEALSRVVSYGPDRRWLLEKAARLRELAERRGDHPDHPSTPRS